jgi:hypothetical protein
MAKVISTDTAKYRLYRLAITKKLFEDGYMQIAVNESITHQTPNAVIEVEICDYIYTNLLTKDDISICSAQLQHRGESKDRICVSISLMINQTTINTYLVTFIR